MAKINKYEGLYYGNKITRVGLETDKDGCPPIVELWYNNEESDYILVSEVLKIESNRVVLNGIIISDKVFRVLNQ